MTLKTKFPVPYLIFLSLLIFVISVFFAVLAVENRSENNSVTTEVLTSETTTEKVKIETTEENITIKETTRLNTTAPQTTTQAIRTTTTKLEQTTTIVEKKPITTQAAQKQTTTNKNSSSNTYFTNADVELVAKILYEECRGVPSDTQKACVVWVICNRVDVGMGSSIQSVAKAKNQFDYNPYAPVKQGLYNLALDVLSRWEREKKGETNVGRVLPKEYLYFHGDGVRNYFRNSYNAPYSIWDYSLSTPYKT